MKTLLITSCFLPLILAAQNSGQNYWQTGYYGVVGSGAQTPSLIPWSKHTNVNHFSAMPGKIITMAAYWNSPGHAIELVASTSQSKLDRVNIMCYDMDVNGKTYTWFVDALWQAGETDKDACDAQAFSFLSRGLARNK